VTMRIVREGRGADSDEEMRQVYNNLKKRGLNPFYLGCRKCGSWLFVFTRNIKPQDFALVYEKYVDMLMNDYGPKIVCPDCGFSNRHLINEFNLKIRRLKG